MRPSRVRAPYRSDRAVGLAELLDDLKPGREPATVGLHRAGGAAAAGARRAKAGRGLGRPAVGEDSDAGTPVMPPPDAAGASQQLHDGVPVDRHLLALERGDEHGVAVLADRAGRHRVHAHSANVSPTSRSAARTSVIGPLLDAAGPPWAERLSEREFRRDNLPWFAYGVSDDDIVEARTTDHEGVFEFVRVIRPSGNRLVRVILEDERQVDSVLGPLVGMGCHYEGANRRFISISVPPSVSLEAVGSHLVGTGLQWEHADPTFEELLPEQQQ